MANCKPKWLSSLKSHYHLIFVHSILQQQQNDKKLANLIGFHVCILNQNPNRLVSWLHLNGFTHNMCNCIYLLEIADCGVAIGNAVEMHKKWTFVDAIIVRWSNAYNDPMHWKCAGNRFWFHLLKTDSIPLDLQRKWACLRCKGLK